MNILVVDDDPIIAATFARLLKSGKYQLQTEVVNDPLAAKDLLLGSNGQRFDLILTDQTMPHMTGTQLVEELRSHGVQIPVIISSGALLPEFNLPGVQFLGKPFRLTTLIALVAAATGITC